MILSARFLDNVKDVNSFNYLQFAELSEGDAPTLYFQLVDLSQGQDCKPRGRRYVPASGATLQVTLDNIDDAKKITRVCTQAYPTQDPSIYTLPILATDGIKGTVNLKLVLTESGVAKNGYVQAALRVRQPASYSSSY